MNTDTPKFGINALAEAAKMPPKIVRKQLRKMGVKKTGRYYDFQSKQGVDEMAAKLTV